MKCLKDAMVYFIYPYVHCGTADLSLLGLSHRDEDKGCQGYLGVVALETTLDSHKEKSF